MKREFILKMTVDWDEEILKDLHPDRVLEDAIPEVQRGVSVRMFRESTQDKEPWDMREEMEYIQRRWEWVKKYGLETEVMYYAFSAMKSDPSLTIVQAFAEGCYEWDI